ncbi:hypothetical protein [Arsukibacterium sp.]|uniref:hypothetical protein n=1 Tax=Arsukibacterium sp. TaxID=1977258 RepID=UPI002FDB524C
MRFSIILIAMLLLVLVFFSGCSARVTLPAMVDEPRTVQLLTHGQHSSILLPMVTGHGMWIMIKA